MHISPNDKETAVVRCSILPAALYGAESTYVSASAINKLSSAIASVIGSGSARRNVEATFALRCRAKDLDPHTHVLYNTVAGTRRLIAKHPNCQTMICEAISMH